MFFCGIRDVLLGERRYIVHEGVRSQGSEWDFRAQCSSVQCNLYLTWAADWRTHVVLGQYTVLSSEARERLRI